MASRTETRAIVRKALLATIPRRIADEVPKGGTHCVMTDALVHYCSHNEICCAHTVFDVCRFAGRQNWEALCAVVLPDDVGDEADLKEKSVECEELAQTLADLFGALPDIERLLAPEEPQS